MLRSFWHRRAAEKSLKAAVEQKRLDRPFTIKHVRVLLDASLGVEESFFTGLAKALNIPPVNVYTFVFPAKNEVEKQYEHFFNPEEVSFFGKFEGELALMCDKEVDLQIHFFAHEDRYMSWVASKAKNKFSVGFSGADQRINDLVFDFAPKATATFQKELVRYLTILEKLEA